MRKNRVPSFLFIMAMGCFLIIETLGRPRLAGIHNVDVLSLVAAGACIGAGFAGTIAAARAKRYPNR